MMLSKWQFEQQYKRERATQLGEELCNLRGVEPEMVRGAYSTAVAQKQATLEVQTAAQEEQSAKLAAEIERAWEEAIADRVILLAKRLEDGGIASSTCGRIALAIVQNDKY